MHNTQAICRFLLFNFLAAFAFRNCPSHQAGAPYSGSACASSLGTVADGIFCLVEQSYVLCIIEAAGAVPHDGQLFYGHHRLSMEPPSAVQKLFLKPACYTGLIPGAIYPYL